MKRLLAALLCAAVVAPAAASAMQKNRPPTSRTVFRPTRQAKAPVATAAGNRATLHRAPSHLQPQLLATLTAGLEASAASAEVAGQAPAAVRNTHLASRSNAQIDAALRAEQEAERARAAAAAARQRAWAD